MLVALGSTSFNCRPPGLAHGDVHGFSFGSVRSGVVVSNPENVFRQEVARPFRRSVVQQGRCEGACAEANWRKIWYDWDRKLGGVSESGVD